MNRNCRCGGRYVPHAALSNALTAAFECNICGDKRVQGKRQPKAPLTECSKCHRPMITGLACLHCAT